MNKSGKTEIYNENKDVEALHHTETNELVKKRDVEIQHHNE